MIQTCVSKLGLNHRSNRKSLLAPLSKLRTAKNMLASSRPHAGQLRYHDYSKLREWHMLRTATPTSILAPRFFWSASGNPIMTTFQNLSIKRLEREAGSKPNDAEAQYEFLNALSEHNHPNAIVSYVRGNSRIALDGNSAILYLQALQQTNQTNVLNADDLLRRVQQTTGAVPPVELTTERKGSKQEQVRQLMTWLSTGSIAGGAAPMAAAAIPGATGRMKGETPKNPLHVAVWNPPGSFRQAIGFFLVRAALILVGISAVSALMDERGLGRGGLGGLNANSKHVQEADGDKSTVRFSDVKGVKEAQAELEEIVLYLRDPSRFTRLGGKLPRGLLLTGPPGTGKTLLAKAIAGEAGVPFFYASGSQFEEVYVGLGAKRVRELFEAAKKKSPAIIFIDEIDAVGGNRRLKDQSSLKMTLNELLVQMDGFDENNGIIVIGATNFAESLDDALLRPGRFDKQVTVPLPDVGGRQEILEMYSKKTKIAPDVDLEVLARGTTGFSGADLFNLINQAALKAAVDGLPHVTMAVLEYAKDKILMGAERTSAIISPETAKATAYHEAGHAIVAVLTPGAMPVHKATIMPRGQALGMVGFLPEGDQTSESLKQMLAHMDVAMGGRVAEEIIFGPDQVTSGASSDIRSATQMARNMVTKWGFSDEIGVVYHGGSTGEESASGQTRAKIDAEVKKLTDQAYSRAKALLEKHKAEHQLLAETLLEYETLTGDEVRELVLKRVKPKRPAVPRRKEQPEAEKTPKKRGFFGNKRVAAGESS